MRISTRFSLSMSLIELRVLAEAQLGGEQCRLDPAADLQLAQDVGHVRLDAFLRTAKLEGDLLVAKPPGEQRQHLALALAQTGERVGRGQRGRAAPQRVGER